VCVCVRPTDKLNVTGYFFWGGGEGSVRFCFTRNILNFPVAAEFRYTPSHLSTRKPSGGSYKEALFAPFSELNKSFKSSNFENLTR
jgi:hypothetical protein